MVQLKKMDAASVLLSQWLEVVIERMISNSSMAVLSADMVPLENKTNCILIPLRRPIVNSCGRGSNIRFSNIIQYQ